MTPPRPSITSARRWLSIGRSRGIPGGLWSRCSRRASASTEATWLPPRAIAARIRERQAELRGQGKVDTLMAPAEDVLCTMVELATRDSAPRDWDELESRSERFSVGQERIEVVETRALAMQNRGRTEEARGHLARALELAGQIPNAMSSRLRRRLHQLD